MYKLTDSSIIIRTTDNASIPADPNNTDYQKYTQWLAQGNYPDTADIISVPLAPSPTILTRKQAKSILLIKGLLSYVQPAISAIPNDLQRGLAQIAWDDATEFKRHDPILLVLAGMLGLSDTQLDELFQEGSVL